MRSWQKGARFLFGMRSSRKMQSLPRAAALWAKHNALFICPRAKRTHFSIETHLFQVSQPSYGWCYLLWGSCSSYSYRNNGIFLTEPEIWMSERGWKLPVLLHWCHLNHVCVCALTAYARFLWEGRRWERKWRREEKKTYLCWVFYCVSVQKQHCVFLLPEHLSD